MIKATNVTVPDKATIGPEVVLVSAMRAKFAIKNTMKKLTKTRKEAR